MVGVVLTFICGVWFICKFVWILCKCDKIKGKVIDGTFHYDKYEYEYKGKIRKTYAWVPFFNQKKEKEYSIWVNKINHTKIYSKNEMYLWASGFFIVCGMIYLFIDELLTYF